MALTVDETLPSDLTVFTDTFARATNAPGAGLGRMPGGPVWQVVSGLWNISGNAPATTTAPEQNPLVAVYTGLDDAEVSAIVGGGDCIYLRVLDATNWVRARLAQETATPAVTWTLHLEVGRTGGVETLASAAVSNPNRLRFVARGATLTAYLNDQVTAALAATSSAHRGALHHGFGRGGSRIQSTRLDTVYVNTMNAPPYAPTLGFPAANATVPTATAARFTWTHRDPDAGDRQSRYQLRWRATGTGADPTWTTWDEATVTEWRDIPAGTFTGGDYEWTVRTYDSRGRVGPWAASRFFTASGAPAAATITYPTSNGVLGQGGAEVEWVAAQQDAYELARFPELSTGEAPDLQQPYETTGIVESGTARSDALRFPVNDRVEWVGVRVRVNGAWSSWSTQRVRVSYFSPAAPGIWCAADQLRARIAVTLANPTPRVGRPVVVKVDVQRRVLDETGNASPTLTVAAGIDPSGYLDYDVRSGAEYDYRVLAYGDNGSTVLSDWASEYVPPAPPAPPASGFSGGFGSGLGAAARRGGFNGGFGTPLGPKKNDIEND